MRSALVRPLCTGGTRLVAAVLRSSKKEPIMGLRGMIQRAPLIQAGADLKAACS